MRTLLRIVSILPLIGLLSVCSSAVPSAPQEPASSGPQKAAEAARDLPSVPQDSAEAARDLPSIRVGEHVVERRRLGNGVFLVASHNLATSMFAETVILITHHESGGTMGLTVNRPSEISLSTAFPDIEQLQGENSALFLGGPVSPRAVFVLLRSDEPQAGMERLAKGIYFSRGLSPILEDSSRNFSGDSTRVFAGYAGWAPGQLEAEIERGDWILAWESPDVAFTHDLKKLWRMLLESWSGRWT
jgi:putative transcriptional regulator